MVEKRVSTQTIVSLAAILLLVCILLTGCASIQTTDRFEPTAESLKQYECPEWFRDAKFGIYFHWGVYSVPAFGSEWYPRWMHFEGHETYKHHVEKYGHPSKFGYHDFVPMFKAEKF
ncbi:MAG: alpha-L-fucosidase, partial [Gammaproteobacteria bacterium]|nr:alpha-L-fucosidase [Gammaproteobacteria bacterium]